MAGGMRASCLGVAALVLLAALFWTAPASAKPPASAQYELSAPVGGTPSGAGQDPTATDPSSERPADVAMSSLDNEEVVLLIALILIVTAAAVAFALGHRRLPRPRRVFALVLAGLTGTALLVAVLPAGGAGTKPPSVPAVWYGMIPQLERPAADYKRMKGIGVDSVRFPMPWDSIETSKGNYDFSLIDRYVERVARAGLEIFPAVNATPIFYGTNCTPDTCFRTLPQTQQQLNAWSDVLKAIVRRYGSQGTFWAQNPNIPKHPVRFLQAWNEENFSFFTEPRSPSAYGKLVKVSARAVRSVDPKVKIVLGGLFAHPKASLGTQATTFLNNLYKVKGIKGSFDGVALHPYAKDASHLSTDVNQIRRVMKRHGDSRTGFYITEMGWGSGHDTAFEKGLQGQSRELAQAFTLLRKMRASAHIQRVFWYSWEDINNSCNFCDSTGLIRTNGSAKPAYGTYRAFALNKR